jgi:hypothetical protein
MRAAGAVTTYCDWTEISESVRERFPIVPREMMEKSVENLNALVAARPQ